MLHKLLVLGAALCVLLAGVGLNGAGAKETVKPRAAGEKVLVVFYSATGNTERVAGYIKDYLNADIFKLTPLKPYTAEDLNYRNRNSRVMRERDDEAMRKITLVASRADNWEAYDTVFIGYPIWSAIAAWPVNAFIENNDFTGKTVIPFCTHGGSGLGRSGELLAKLAGSGSWTQGKAFASGAGRSTVERWLRDEGF